MEHMRSLRDKRYKRVYDLAVLVSALIILLPLWCIIWIVVPLLIWLEDKGPVFYRQKRCGKNGRVIKVLKFRTMQRDADKIGPVWNSEGDPRVTFVGRALRKSGLDELPQVLNILKGDMSFVGPRALAVDEQKLLERRIPGYGQRLAVRPGLTGVAQVYDRDDDAKTKLKYDLLYIEKMNAWLDLRLMLISACNTVLGRWDRRAAKIRQADVIEGGVASKTRQRKLDD